MQESIPDGGNSMRSRMDGHHNPAAAGAPFVPCVEDGKECMMAGLGRAVDGGSLTIILNAFSPSKYLDFP